MNRRRDAFAQWLTQYTLQPPIKLGGYEIEIEDGTPAEPGPTVGRDWSRGSSFIPGLRIEYSRPNRDALNRQVWYPFDPKPGGVPALWELQSVVGGGRFLLPDGKVLDHDDPLRERIVARLLGDSEMLAPVFDPSTPEAQRRPYLPGLWNHSTTPAFVGPKEWGKSRFLCPLAAALIIPGRRFLDFFEPAELTDEERGRDVWLINPESPPADIHELLLMAGLRYGRRAGVPCYFSEEYGTDAGVLIVDHLTMRGGPTSFDLTDPVKADVWATRLIEYGDRDVPPLTVIADGVTSVLGSVTSRYGLFSSAFRAMHRQVGITNGLGVLHSPMGVGVITPMGGVESMGEWDGLWLASASAHPVTPTSSRHLQISARLLGPVQPRRSIVLDPDGGLRMAGDEQEGESPVPTEESEDYAATRAAILGRLRSAPDGELWTRDVCPEDYAAEKKVLDLMEQRGEVTPRKVQEGRTRGVKWRLAVAEEV